MALVCLGMSGSLRQAPVDDFPPELENSAVFSRNAEPPHATFIPFDSSHDALKKNFTESPFYLCLDGLWKFKWVAHPADRPRDFYKESYDVGSWTDFPVPSNWEFKGYGQPIYLDEANAFRGDPPHVPHDNNPVGSYRRSFTVPENWKGR